MLTVAGWRVTFLTSSAMIGANLPSESVSPLLARLGAAGTTFRVLCGVEATGQGGVQAVNLTSGQEEWVECDLAVFQTGRKVNAGPTAQSGATPLYRVGDCVTPRRITHALFEARRAARTI
jgi:2,4-dienoyl-CoA reductase (NADPH2)